MFSPPQPEPYLISWISMQEMYYISPELFSEINNLLDLWCLHQIFQAPVLLASPCPQAASSLCYVQLLAWRGRGRWGGEERKITGCERGGGRGGFWRTFLKRGLIPDSYDSWRHQTKHIAFKKFLLPDQPLDLTSALAMLWSPRAVQPHMHTK